MSQSAYFSLGNSPSDDAKTCENRLLLVPALRAHQARPIIRLFFCPTQLLRRGLRSQVKTDVYLVDQKNLLDSQVCHLTLSAVVGGLC